MSWFCASKCVEMRETGKPALLSTVWMGRYKLRGMPVWCVRECVREHASLA